MYTDHQKIVIWFVCLSFSCLQSVQMFIDHQIGYLDIMKLNEACCEAHQKELIAMPNLEEIVHYDQWARRWVKEAVESGKYKPRVAVQAATAAA
jgi:1-deoxy-D-xylulose-5-phosphate reductoisomerase